MVRKHIENNTNPCLLRSHLICLHVKEYVCMYSHFHAEFCTLPYIFEALKAHVPPLIVTPLKEMVTTHQDLLCAQELSAFNVRARPVNGAKTTFECARLLSTRCFVISALHYLIFFFLFPRLQLIGPTVTF